MGWWVVGWVGREWVEGCPGGRGSAPLDGAGLLLGAGGGLEGGPLPGDGAADEGAEEEVGGAEEEGLEVLGRVWGGQAAGVRVAAGRTGREE